MADDKPKSSDAPNGWRGTAASKANSIPEYRWQSGEREVASPHASQANLKRRLKILGFGGLIAALTCLFLNELLYSRPRTPLIVLAPTDYKLPFQPLPWSQEDIDSLRELDRETIDVYSVDVGWKTKDQGLKLLDEQLKRAVRQQQRSQTIVLYLRMHSAVDGEGIPCLVPPSASPFNSDTWLPIKDILDRFRAQNVADTTRKLVVFDCSGVLSDWNQGVIFNTFNARLPDAIAALGIPNLVVLNAAGSSEIAATSSEMKHGVFGHFLKLGLSGAADAVSESGNGDRLVTVRELHRYLARHVDQWSLKNRGLHQRPQLISPESVDFEVTSVLNPRAAKRFDSASRRATNPSLLVSASEIEALWKKLEECESLDPLRFDPLAWAGVEQRLRWLEVAAESGEAYARCARQILLELQQRFSTVNPQEEQDRRDRTPLSNWVRFSNEPVLRNSSARICMLPLAQQFDTMTPAAANRLRTILATFKSAPTASNLLDVSRALADDVELSQLELTCLLQVWHRYDVTRLWQESDFLASVIELHELAEASSVPSDERVVRWIRSTIETADASRRNVEDQVFLGGEIPANELAKAKRLYLLASQIGHNVSQAYSTRDRIAHALPYVAQWLTSPSIEVSGSSSSIHQTKSLLFDLARNLNSLERNLSKPSVLLQEDLVQLPFQGLLTDIKLQQEQLTGLMSAEYERLIRSETSTASVWWNIHNLLAVPLLPPANDRMGLAPAQQRKLLKDKLNQVDRNLFESYGSPARRRAATDEDEQSVSNNSEPSKAADRGSGRMTMSEYLDEMLVKGPDHLAMSIVRREAYRTDGNEQDIPSPSSVTKHDIETIAEVQGQRFRQFMASVPEAVASDCESQVTSTEDQIFQNALSERLARTTASLGMFRLDGDPIKLRRKSDLQLLLLWHSRRMINDFLGKSSPEDASFFDLAGSNLLQLADSVGKPTSHAQLEAAATSSLLNKYKNAAEGGLTTVSDNLLVADESETIIAKIAVYQNKKTDNLFPPGRGAVYVRDLNGQQSGEIRPLFLPWDSAVNSAATATQFDIPLKDVHPGNRSTNLNAVASFRGHDYVGKLSVNSIGGVEIDYSPLNVHESRISIRGRRFRKLSVVFVLDCSNSMSQELPLERERQQVPRLQIAKLALGSMLDKLAEDEGHRVGVICFGHRIGWDVKQAGQLLRQTGYSAPIPDGIRPYDDIETILPLGRFNASFAGSVSERLASVRPWGESPLNLALIQALKQFGNDDDDSDNCIVVITDGMNYQFNAPAQSRKTTADVMAAWADHRVPIHIVGLGIAPDQALAAQNEFDDLARRTGGSYVSAQEARTLAESLAVLQRVSQFRVRGETGMQETAEIGQPIIVETDPHRRNEFEVTLGPAVERVALHGGELVELLPTRNGQTLEVAAYATGQPQFVSLVNDDKQNSATEVVVGIHRPFRRGRSVTFEISLQQRERHFLERPANVWMEIEPIGRPGQSNPPTYVFYDNNFVANTSVPVMRWTVNDWPTEAKQAKVRVWCRPNDVEPTSTISLQTATDPGLDPDVAVQGIQGVNSRVRIRENGTLQVSVVERHSTDSLGVGSIKVGFRSSVIPLHVRHRFDAVNRLATHLFEFSRQDVEILKDGEIQFTSRAAIQAGAFRTPDATIVDVTESGDVHD